MCDMPKRTAKKDAAKQSTINALTECDLYIRGCIHSLYWNIELSYFSFEQVCVFICSNLFYNQQVPGYCG